MLREQLREHSAGEGLRPLGTEATEHSGAEPLTSAGQRAGAPYACADGTAVVTGAPPSFCSLLLQLWEVEMASSWGWVPGTES